MLKNSIRIAVLVSGGGTNLQALLDAKERGEIPCGEFALVVSSKEGAYALERAKKANIPSLVIGKAEYPDLQEREQALIKAMEENKIDLIVLAGYLSILSEHFTKKYADRILNVHPALIPSFCGKGFYGLKVHEAALYCGVKVTGATVHFVNEIPDGGKIIMQKAVEVQEGDTPETLQRRVMEEAEWIILPKAVALVAKQIKETKERNDG